MKIWFNAFPNAYGWPSRRQIEAGENAVLVDSTAAFNWDAIPRKHNTAEQEFLDTLKPGQWVQLPEELLDYTTLQNFGVYVRAAKNQDTKYRYFYDAYMAGEE